FHGHFYLSALSISSHRGFADEFSFAPFLSAYAGQRVCRPRVHAARLSGSDSQTLPVLQLRRLHADSVSRSRPNRRQWIRCNRCDSIRSPIDEPAPIGRERERGDTSPRVPQFLVIKEL